MTGVSELDLQSALKFWNSLISPQEAGKKLDLCTARLHELIRMGILKSVQLGSSRKYYPRKDVEALIEAIDRLPDISSTKGYLPIRKFCCYNGIPMTKLLAEWCLGRADGILFRGNNAKTGVGQIYVLADACPDCLDTHFSGDLMLRQAASHLKISVISIRRIRDAGLLVQIRKRNSDTMRQHNYISKGSIRRFEERFITLGQLAKLSGKEARHLARALDQDGIEPIECPTGFVRVYSIRDFPKLMQTSTQGK